MNFEYEITVADYVAAQLLHDKLSNRRRRYASVAGWVSAGLLFLVVAWNEKVLTWASFLLLFTGSLWICTAVLSLFPARYFRRSFRKTELKGKRFKAELTDDGFDVTGEDCGWRVSWVGGRLKGEDEKVFMLSTLGTIFIFGKRYFNADQQKELRRLSGMKS